MRFSITDSGINIEPESPQDEAYIEYVLGLTEHGSVIALVRENRAFDGKPGHQLLRLRTKTSGQLAMEKMPQMEKLPQMKGPST